MNLETEGSLQLVLLENNHTDTLTGSVGLGPGLIILWMLVFVWTSILAMSRPVTVSEVAPTVNEAQVVHEGIEGSLAMRRNTLEAGAVTARREGEGRATFPRRARCATAAAPRAPLAQPLALVEALVRGHGLSSFD